MKLHRFELDGIRAPKRMVAAVRAQLGMMPGRVPVDEVARALDVAEVCIRPFDGFEGMLLTDARRSKGAILANGAKGAQRARFTIAHELGHFLLEWHQQGPQGGFMCAPRDLRQAKLSAADQHKRQDAEANNFAAELLVPTAWVRQSCSGDPDLGDAQRLRKTLDVSTEVAVRRMVEVRPELLAAVWSFKGMVSYTIRSEKTPFITCRRKTRMPTESGAWQQVEARQTGTSPWQDVDPTLWTDQQGLHLFEQMRLSNSGHAVTLLWFEEDPDGEEEDDARLPPLGVPTFKR